MSSIEVIVHDGYFSTAVCLSLTVYILQIMFYNSYVVHKDSLWITIRHRKRYVNQCAYYSSIEQTSWAMGLVSFHIEKHNI